MGFIGPILIKLWTSSIRGFLYLPLWWPLGSYLCKHAGDHSVTIEACSSPHLTCLGLCGMVAWKLMEPFALWHCVMLHGWVTIPWQQGSWGRHGTHLEPTGPIWAPWWPHALCESYICSYRALRGTEKVCYAFSRSSVPFQYHTGQIISPVAPFTNMV